MKQNMYEWLKALQESGTKLPLPILSFPGIQLVDGLTVRELVSDSAKQAAVMEAVAGRVRAAASVGFMDLSVEAECFGAEVAYTDGEVPTVVGRRIEDAADAEALQVPAVGAGRTSVYLDAVRMAKEKISDRPVFAGMIGSFSLAGRLLDVTEAMVLCYTDPELLHTVLGKVTEFLIAYGLAFRAAGADGILVAEPLAGLLGPEQASEFSEPYIRRIVEAVQNEHFLVIYHNCGNAAVQMLDSILRTGAAAYHFGNAIRMAEVLERVPAETVVMGNLDPAGELRNGTVESVRAATQRLMEECGRYANFVPSSGCDIPPQAKWENIDAFFEAVSEYYRG